MTFQPIKTALKYISAWSMVAGFVALLTIIFSFLGALFCAALGGMMMGATKASRRLSLCYSLICPGVLFGVMRSQKTELADRQITALLLICLAAFWVLYFISAALMAQEQKSASSNGKLAPSARSELRSAAARLEAVPTEPTAIANNGNGNGKLVELRPEALEGQWRSDICDQNGRAHQRILEIKDGAAVLSTLDAEGHLHACAKGRLQWIDSPAQRTLTTSAEADEAFPSPAI